MENLGYLAILFSFCLCVYGVVAALVGKLRNKPFLEVSAQRSVVAVWVLVTTASALLLYAILSNDFRYSYVAGRSNIDLPLIYKLAAWWGGQEGSLMFWSWMVGSATVILLPLAVP